MPTTPSRPRHETRALLRAHLSAAARYGHDTRHCPICHRLQRLAMEPGDEHRPAPRPEFPAEPSGPPGGAGRPAGVARGEGAGEAVPAGPADSAAPSALVAAPCPGAPREGSAGPLPAAVPATADP